MYYKVSEKENQVYRVHYIKVWSSPVYLSLVHPDNIVKNSKHYEELSPLYVIMHDIEELMKT